MSLPDPGAQARAVEAREQLRRRISAARIGREPGSPARSRSTLELLHGYPVVAAHASTGAEPDCWAMIDALVAAGTRVLLPVLTSSPDWAWYVPGEPMDSSWRGIRQPRGPRLGATALGMAQAVVLPGLAGTPSGDRLGTGGGWYDRALLEAGPPLRLLLLNDDEVVEELPAQPWDQPVDVIITEARVIETRARAEGNGPVRR